MHLPLHPPKIMGLRADFDTCSNWGWGNDRLLSDRSARQLQFEANELRVVGLNWAQALDTVYCKYNGSVNCGYIYHMRCQCCGLFVKILQCWKN